MFLFILTNVLVIATISIILSVLGIQPYLTAKGINYTSLAIFCALWGTGGAFISLLMSKFMAKQFMGVTIIDPNTTNGQERQLLNVVYSLASRAGLPKNPEVGIYNSPEVNAFATGPSKSNALVAVSSGLLNQMSRNEVEGVLGHEITHIANGDMVTMTLIQGIVNAFAMFLSRIVAYAISIAMSKDEEGEGISYVVFYILTFVFDICFTLLGSIVVAFFSRWREFRADQGGARLAGKTNMINALERLKQMSEIQDNHAPSFAALKISHQSTGIRALFASHPPLELRIERLQKETF